jgi:hypothetical protein
MADARFANTPSEPHRLGGFDQRPIFAGMPTLTAAAATSGSPELKIQLRHLSSVTKKFRRFLEALEFCIPTAAPVPHTPDWSAKSNAVRITQGAGRAAASVRFGASPKNRGYFRPQGA